jgi:D-amino-acid dehydrogenase
MDGLIAAPARAPCCARTVRSSFTRARRSSRRRCPAGRRATASASPIEHVAASELAELQPGLSPRVSSRAHSCPAGRPSPTRRLLGKAIWAYAPRRKGARFVQGAVVVAVVPSPTARGHACARGRTLAAAACRRRRRLVASPARQVRRPHPARNRARLQHDAAAGAFDVKRQLIFGGHGFVITPLSTGCASAARSNSAGSKRRPIMPAPKPCCRRQARFLPGLRTAGGTRMDGLSPVAARFAAGHRPSRARANVVYAFGHGHLGLTQAAATGRLSPSCVTGRPPAIDLSPFSPQRF